MTEALKTQLTSRQLGLGTFPFSGVFSPIDQAGATQLVHRFVEMGGRYIETAPIYPRTNVDLASVLATLSRSDYFLGSKCVLHLDAGLKTHSSGRAASLRRQCLDELERLGVDYLDLLQAHVTAEDASQAEVSAALNELRHEGLVRYVGVSNASAGDIAEYLKGGSIDFVQNRYSIVHRAPTDAVASICADNHILFNPFQIIERGQLLSGSAPGEWRDGDLRSSKAEYMGDAYARIALWACDHLRPIAEDAGLTLEALSIRWVFSRPQVTLPVVGATTVEQVERNMQVGTDPLPEDVLRLIDESYSELSDDLRRLFGLSVEEFRGLA